MQYFALFAIATVLARHGALAEEMTNAPALAATNAPPALSGEPGEKLWSYSAAAYTYFVPDDRDYFQPTITADRGPLHFEARYNYEGLDSGSAWVGYNYSGGQKLAW